MTKPADKVVLKKGVVEKRGHSAAFLMWPKLVYMIFASACTYTTLFPHWNLYLCGLYNPLAAPTSIVVQIKVEKPRSHYTHVHAQSPLYIILPTQLHTVSTFVSSIQLLRVMHYAEVGTMQRYGYPSPHVKGEAWDGVLPLSFVRGIKTCQ